MRLRWIPQYCITIEDSRIPSLQSLANWSLCQYGWNNRGTTSKYHDQKKIAANDPEYKPKNKKKKWQVGTSANHCR